MHPSQKVSVSLQTKHSKKKAKKNAYIKNKVKCIFLRFSSIFQIQIHSLLLIIVISYILSSFSYSFSVTNPTAHTVVVSHVRLLRAPRGNSFDKTGNKFSQLLSNLTKPYGILFSKLICFLLFFLVSFFFFFYYIQQSSFPQIKASKHFRNSCICTERKVFEGFQNINNYLLLRV